MKKRDFFMGVITHRMLSKAERFGPEVKTSWDERTEFFSKKNEERIEEEKKVIEKKIENLELSKKMANNNQNSILLLDQLLNKMNSFLEN